MAWNLVSNNGSVSSELDDDNTRYDFTLDAYGDFSEPVVYTRPYNSPTNELLVSYTPEPDVSPSLDHHNFSHGQLSSFLKEKLEETDEVQEELKEPEKVQEEPEKVEKAEKVQEEPDNVEKVEEIKEPDKVENLEEQPDNMPIIFLTVNIIHDSPYFFNINCIFMFLFGMFIKDIFRSYYYF